MLDALFCLTILAHGGSTSGRRAQLALGVNGLECDEAVLTGEATPAEKSADDVSLTINHMEYSEVREGRTRYTVEADTARHYEQQQQPDGKMLEVGKVWVTRIGIEPHFLFH
jgi:magnesium-transporting ATPase (P-type)